MIKGQDLQTRISYYLAEQSDKDQEVLLFGLRLITTTIIGYILLIVFSIPFRATWQTLVAALTVSSFRVISGGAHATTQARCSLIGVIVFVPLGILARYCYSLISPYIPLLLVVIFIFGLGGVYLYVPADTPGKPINSVAQKRYLRGLSYIIFVIWSLGAYVCYKKNLGLAQGFILASILGMCWQIYTLTPAGYTTFKILDGFLKIMMGERG